MQQYRNRVNSPIAGPFWIMADQRPLFAFLFVLVFALGAECLVVNA